MPDSPFRLACSLLKWSAERIFLHLPHTAKSFPVRAASSSSFTVAAQSSEQYVSPAACLAEGRILEHTAQPKAATLPGISIPVALPGGCTIPRGTKTGKWDFPKSATGSIRVAALLPVDAQISAKPPLTAPDGLVGSPSLSWTRAFRSAGDSLVAPQYAIQTNDTTRLANVNLFVAGLLGGAALGGIFEISREWPTNFSLRSHLMEPSAVRAPGAGPKPPFTRISRHPEWRSTIHPVRRRSRQSRGTR